MFDVHLEYASNTVRIGLRVIFTLLLLAIAIAGDRCCRNRVRRQLLKLHDVKIMDTTGWLSGVEAAVTMFSSHSSPAGFLGFLMVFTTIMWTVTDLAVSGLVVTVSLPGRCNFDTNLYYSFIENTPYNYTNNPPYTGFLFNLVTNAQATSIANGGLGGIYKKLNADPTFRADTLDVIGTWNCNATGEESFPLDMSAPDIDYALGNQSVIYPAFASTCWETHPDNSIGHVVAISSSEVNPSIGEPVPNPWQVRAAVDMLVPGPKRAMNIYQCSMDAPSVEWVLRQVEIDSMLSQWCFPILSSIYMIGNDQTPFIDTPDRVLEVMLNNIVMISGSAWELAELPLIEGTQGCLAPHAAVPWPVLLLLAMVIALAIGLFLYWIVLAIQIASAERSGLTPEYVRTIRTYTPIGMRGWMKHSIKLTGGVRDIDSKSLKHWAVGHGTKGMGIGVVRADQNSGHIQPLVMEFTDYAPGHYDVGTFK